MKTRCGICGHFGCVASDFEDAHTRIGIRPPVRHPIYKKNNIVEQDGTKVYINMVYDGDKFIWPGKNGFVEWYVIDENNYRVVEQHDA